MKRFLCFAVFTVCLMSSGCGGKINWKEFSDPAGKFSAEFPGEPKKEVRSQMGLTMTMHLVELRNGAYGVSVVDVPPGTPINYPGAIQGMAASNDGTVTKQNDWKFEGATGKEVEMTIKKPKTGYASARIIVLNNRMYQVLAIGTNTSLDNADVKKFFDSFKIIK